MALAVATLAVSALAVVVGLFARGWWRSTGGSYAPSHVLATSTISPQSSLFGDLLTAEVAVAIDPRRVDPETVRLDPRFGPFTIRWQRADVERNVGRATILHFRYGIECVVAACVPLLGKRAGSDSIQTKAVELPPARLSARSRSGTTLIKLVAWPPLTVHSRLTADEIGFSTPRVAPWFRPPSPSWRLNPDLVGGLSLSVAVLLLLGSAVLVTSVAADDTKLLRLRRLPRLSPVERALRLAEHAAANGEIDEERKALERLAEELARTSRTDLAERARFLAWSERDPASNGLSSLAETLRSNGAS